jgi:predicted 3-demethylubiquinone-9 3-methyltransferase (glyoxalase superfamily)
LWRYDERIIVLREGEFSVDYPKQKITTFLMLDGKAEEAMNYYVSIFDRAEILSIHRYGASEAGAEGTVVHATFALAGQVFMCMDSNVKQDFTFTPSISLYVACATEEEIDRLFETLSLAGKVLMPLAAYPFSNKFAWVEDKYGVSWQLNLERN